MSRLNDLRSLPAWLARPISPRAPWFPWLLATVAILLTSWLLVAEPLRYYRLHSDDFKYLADSRTLSRAIEHLYRPHNTHIVPAWRMLTWSVSAWAGTLSNLQDRLAKLTFAALAIVLLQIGRLVARETRSTLAGLASMALMGINWIIYSSATWYSSGQTLWASASILAALGFTQSYRFSAGAWKLAASAICCYLAGGFWTVGHIAGPVAAVDLWAEGSKRCRRAAVIPLLASMASVALALTLGGSDINGRISFHGRTSRQALNVPMGVSHTLQSIPETLVCGNLGLLAPTTPMQGAILTAGLFALWLWSIKRNAPTPLELAGLAIVMSSYLFEWSYRGYLPFTSLRKVVPWYDTIPQVGFVLFLGGFIARGRNHRGSIGPLSRGGVIALTVLVCALYFVHRPRVDELFLERVPEMDENEAAFYLIPELHQLRGRALWEEFANWQRLHLAKLDQTELAARRLGIGLEQMRDAFDRLPAPECPEVYDAIDLLDLPASGKSIEPAVVRALLGPLVRMEPEPRLPPPQEIIPAVTEGLRNERSP